jgi:hypothetical protein
MNKMTLEELYQLHELLSKWILDPSWNKTSDAWANIVETRRQVEIDINEAGGTVPG